MQLACDHYFLYLLFTRILINTRKTYSTISLHNNNSSRSCSRGSGSRGISSNASSNASSGGSSSNTDYSIPKPSAFCIAIKSFFFNCRLCL